jgi:uncharacterized iron-regulated membrane protein
MLCVTGLPLIFHDEIDAGLNPDAWAPAHPDGPYLSYDEIRDIALSHRPGEVPIFMSFDIERPVVNVTTGPVANAPVSDMHFASFDRTSGDLVPPSSVGSSVMEFFLQLHTDMFLGLPGMFFLGAMGLVFIISLVSGVVLYAPFMRKLAFGEVRRSRSSQIKWLDYHNLLGIVATGWLFVVGLTGTINTLEGPIIDTWREGELSVLLERRDSDIAVKGTSSLDAAIASASLAAPAMELQFVAFPGSDFSTHAHYAIFFHGRRPLTERIITPVLVNAQDGTFEGLREMPWYVKALSLSRPLHFGDYGGIVLKVLWALFDIITIIILVSGLYLLIAKERSSTVRAAKRSIKKAKPQ